jgi:transcriptional regulator with XRE-family HTH domain
MTEGPNALGEYLRARRELVTPEQAGVPALGIRRVAGLRREEVAMLAGVSADYYLRLEQGRDRNPSVQVLESTALSPRFVTGANRLRDLFLDPAERAFFPDWDQATRGIVAGFRESDGTDTDDPRFIELVGELSLASRHFRQLWARHDVRVPQGGGPMRVDHPQVGELWLNLEKLAISATAEQRLVLYHADPGTDDADKLALLSSAALTPASTSANEQAIHAE